jgi:hypothetical protein
MIPIGAEMRAACVTAQQSQEPVSIKVVECVEQTFIPFRNPLKAPQQCFQILGVPNIISAWDDQFEIHRQCSALKHLSSAAA